MRTPAPSSLIAALLLAAAPVRAENDPALAAVEAKVREAAQAEKAEDCETAWEKYREAEEQLDAVVERRRAGELEAIVANKLDKLEECYQSCQPTERQRALMGKAKNLSAEGEVKRATQMAKRLLVGRNEKCRFWKDARVFLRTLPKQAEEQDQDLVDPCEVNEQTAAELQAVREATRARMADLAMLEGDPKVASKLNELVELVRGLDQARLRIYDLREAFLDCENVYAPLAADAQTLRESFTRTQELVFTTYQGQVAGLSKKIGAFKKQLAAREGELAKTKEQLDAHKLELERLKTQFDALTAFNEELFDDLFQLAGAESLSFTTSVEGRRIEQPVEEIRALIADQSKTMQALSAKYPEYFTDGANLEALKRKKASLENLEKMLTRFADRGGKEKLGYERALTEIDATIQMMEKTIAANEEDEPEAEVAQARAPSLMPVFLLAGAGVLVLGGVGGAVFYSRRQRVRKLVQAACAEDEDDDERTRIDPVDRDF